MLHVGRQNVYHLYYKVPALCVFVRQSKLVTTSLVSLPDSRICDWNISIQVIIFREEIQLLLDRPVLQYAYTVPLINFLTIHTGLKALKLTLLNTFGLN